MKRKKKQSFWQLKEPTAKERATVWKLTIGLVIFSMLIFVFLFIRSLSERPEPGDHKRDYARMASDEIVYARERVAAHDYAEAQVHFEKAKRLMSELDTYTPETERMMNDYINECRRLSGQ